MLCALQMSRMAPQGSVPVAEKYMRGDSSSGRGQSDTPPLRSRPGLSGPHHSGPSRAPLSPYSSGSNGSRGQHSSSRVWPLVMQDHSLLDASP